MAFNFKNTVLAAVLLSALSFVGCQKESAVDNGKIKVYTSFYPMYDFACKVGGDKADVVNIIPSASEPHDWEPTVKDMQAVADADVLIYNGLGMEQWADDIAAASGNDSLILVEASKGVELIYSDTNSQNSVGNVDPHTWVSLKNAVIEAENIKNALCEADSGNAAYYEENYQKYKAELEELDAEFADAVSKGKKKDIIVAHDSFSYLCRDYGLNQTAISGLSAEDEPDPSKMAEIVKLAKEKGIKVIFCEELVSTKIAQVVADEVGGEIMFLSPLEALSEEEGINGDDYISVMRKNLDAIKEALE